MERRLYKSRTNKIIAGVCGGLAEYFNIDPVIVRVIAIVLIPTGSSILAYLILWVVAPFGPENEIPRS